MLRPAFSTVACPEWTLQRIAETAGRLGFAGVELRSFGYGSSRLAGDPGLTDGRKVRRIFFHEEGVEIAGIGTGCRFDQPVFPPVIGLVGTKYEAPVRDARQYIDIACEVGAEYVRVFGFQPHGRETARSAMRRICDRLRHVCDHARHRDVQVLLENGGAFSRTEDLLHMLDRVNSPLLGVSYDILPARLVGDDPVAGLGSLGRKVKVVRVRDRKGDRTVPLGEGDLPVREFLRAAARSAPRAWAVFSWDRMWEHGLAEPDDVLGEAARRLYQWCGTDESSTRAA